MKKVKASRLLLLLTSLERLSILNKMRFYFKKNHILFFLLILFITNYSFAGYYNLNSFWSAPGTPAKLVFMQNPSSIGSAGTALTTQPIVAVTDIRGRLATSAADSITLAAFTDNTCSTPASGTLTVTANPSTSSGGRASFAGVTYSDAGTIYLGATASGRTLACSSGILFSASGSETPPPIIPLAQKLKITGDSPIATATCTPYTISITDYWGRYATSSSIVNINLFGAGSGNFYSDSNCSSSIVTTQIPANSPSKLVYFKNPTVETDILIVQDQSGALDIGTLEVSIFGLKLVFTAGPQAMLSDQACGTGTAYTLEYQNGDGTAASGTISVNIDGYQSGSGGGASKIYSASGCTGGAVISGTGPVNITGGTPYTFYYKPPSGITEGTFFIFTATTTGNVKSASRTVAVNYFANGTPGKAVIAGVGELAPNVCSEYTIITMTGVNNLLAGVSSNTAFNLSATGDAEIYSDSNCLNITSSVVLAAGTNTKKFYLKLKTTSTTVTASSVSWTPTAPVTLLSTGQTPQVSTGAYHSCTILSDGRIKCWGYNANGEFGNGTTTNSSTPVLGPTLSSVVQIVAGAYHTCALLYDSTVRCWGDNTYSQLGDGSAVTNSTTPVVVSGLSTVTQLSARGYYTCARLSNGTIKCWGQNSNGKLGNGNTTNSNIPVLVSGISNAKQVSTGWGNFTCAVLNDGTIKCWGYNFSGQLGDGTNTNSLAPVIVSGISNAVEVQTGFVHSCARLSDSTVKCWGKNSEGQLGDGGTTDSNVPVVVPSLSNVTQLSLGGNQLSVGNTCALISDGTVKCWGYGGRGQLGYGSGTNSSTPGLVSGISTALAISSGWDHTCSLLSDGRVKCWGLNDNGQIGNGTYNGSSILNAVSVTDINNATQISANGYVQTYAYDHACAVLSDSTIKCWGYNGAGQLGNNSIIESSTPVLVSGINTATQVASGGAHSCARLSNSAVKCWGSNANGRLGNGNTTNSLVPVDVLTINDASDISLGRDHSCVVRSSTSKVFCWGYNSSGQLGTGNTTESNSPIEVLNISTATQVSSGFAHTCARLSDSTIKCWGINTEGRLGTGNTTQLTSPSTAVVGISNAIQVAAGHFHSCATLSDSTIKCWGKNNYGQLGNGLLVDSSSPVTVLGINNATQVSVGDYYSCARLSDGSIKCWGYNSSGQLGSGTTVTSLAPILVGGVSGASSVTTGSYLTCARISSNSSVKCWGYNLYGQVGVPETRYYITPTYVVFLPEPSHSSLSIDPCRYNLTPGTVCPGGGILLGVLDPGATEGAGNYLRDKYMITPGGCGEIPAGQIVGSGASAYPSADFTPTCSGTDTLRKTWNDGTSNWTDILGLTNYTATVGVGNGDSNTDASYGSSNTTNIVAITIAGQGGYHAAARYCDMLNYGGYTDWYLPNRYELNLAWTNVTSIPGLDTSGNYYWSSTESASNGAWIQSFFDGYQGNSIKGNSFIVRCVRRF